MPSKKKKQPRNSPPPASPSPSPSPSPSRMPSRGPQPSDDEEVVVGLLSRAAEIFPGFISKTAFFGRVSETEPQSSRNDARVWLSEAAMVALSVRPGSVVSVSLAAVVEKSPNGCPLDALSEECARHYGFEVGDEMANSAGSYFAVATVSHSCEVLKNGARLSWALSSTMGFPAPGRVIFISDIGSFLPSPHLDKNSNKFYAYLCKCKELYLSLVPSSSGAMKHEGLPRLKTSGELPNGSGNVASPKTPAYHSKLCSPTSAPNQLKYSPEHSLIAKSSGMSVIKDLLLDEKTGEILQICVARWLNGRRLLCGNFVTVPVCGIICLFRVDGADKFSADCTSQELYYKSKCDLFSAEAHISSPLNFVERVLVVDAKTQVQLSDPTASYGQNAKISGLPKFDLSDEECRDKEVGDIPRLGGLSKELADLKEIIMFSLSEKTSLPRTLLPSMKYKGVLLYGPPGTGKTSLASSCARDAGAKLLSIKGPEFVSEYYGESEKALEEVFRSAKQSAPSVVFLDELDAIAPTRKDGGEGLSVRIVATLLQLMDEISRDDRILVIAATNRPDSIDPALRRPGRLDREIEIGVPSPGQRKEILHTLLDEVNHSLNSKDVQSLAVATHGFVGADLAALRDEAVTVAFRRYLEFKNSGRHLEQSCDVRSSDAGKVQDTSSMVLVDSLSSLLSELSVTSEPVCSQSALENSGASSCLACGPQEEELLLKVTAEDFENAKMKVKPSAMREVMLEFPKVRWEDVGGQTEVKQQLIEAVLWPQRCPDAFERMGIRPPRGLLMIGPPGCSKTLMARAVASEAELNFLAVKGPELFSKWVGESEKAVKSLFAKARANSPAIIFFDELDGLAITRGQEDDGTSVADRVLDQLLVEMDGLGQRDGVTVIAATNRPDKIDQALLRPGRFDRLLDVQPPELDDREQIFSIHTRSMPCSFDVNLKELAHLTEGYTGADIKLICREAAIVALEESLEISEVSMAHFKIGTQRVQPSDVKSYQKLAMEFRRHVNTRSRRDE